MYTLLPSLALSLSIGDMKLRSHNPFGNGRRYKCVRILVLVTFKLSWLLLRITVRILTRPRNILRVAVALASQQAKDVPVTKEERSLHTAPAAFLARVVTRLISKYEVVRWITRFVLPLVTMLDYVCRGSRCTACNTSTCDVSERPGTISMTSTTEDGRSHQLESQIRGRFFVETRAVKADDTAETLAENLAVSVVDVAEDYKTDHDEPSFHDDPFWVAGRKQMGANDFKIPKVRRVMSSPGAIPRHPGNGSPSRERKRPRSCCLW